MSQIREELEQFRKLVFENRYDFCKLVYIIFPFGQPGHALEHMAPYDWQMEEWAKMSKWFQDPATRDKTYYLNISSGNGAAKTSFGAMTTMMLLYTQRLHARITANTMPQMTSIVWPEYDIWFNHARYVHSFFEKLGTSIKALDAQYAEKWRLDTVTWAEQSPQAISGLHNKGGAVMYIFEEAPGIPAIIWKYAEGAFTETGTMKLFLAFGNSDDPNSKFEQNMTSPFWHSRRIDTRELSHINQDFVAKILAECGGDEDHDDFRVRVRGMPRKTAKDSVISIDLVKAGFARAKKFERDGVSYLPMILGCDPAWQGGDETVIWARQGNWAKMVEKYKLDKTAGETHQYTYSRLCYWEKELGADAVNIDQAEGTGIYTLALNAGKTSWEVFSFASSPYDTPEFKDSQYANLRAQMHYEGKDWLQKGGVLEVGGRDGQQSTEWREQIEKEFCAAKGTRHAKNGKKLVEAKQDIKERIGKSPDTCDGFVLTFARVVLDRLPENDVSINAEDRFTVGQTPFRMPEHSSPYQEGEVIEAQYRDLYD